MRNLEKNIGPGIYLVVDPAMEKSLLLNRLEEVLAKGIAAVQIWDHFKKDQDVFKLIQAICVLCNKNRIPLLINNHWEYLKTIGLDGVHFDDPPPKLSKIKAAIGRDFIVGITCDNDLSQVQWAAEHEVDYISFCSMFPSKSAVDCEIVNFDTVRKARQLFNKPLFLAGGIYPETIDRLSELQYDGIAVISGIMSSDHPARAMDAYTHQLNAKS